MRAPSPSTSARVSSSSRRSALALERVLAQLGDPLAQLVQLGAQLRVALGPLALGCQRLLERLHPGARRGLLLGQLAALILAGTLNLLQPGPRLAELVDQRLRPASPVAGQLLEAVAREGKLDLEHLAIGGERALQLLQPGALPGELLVEPATLLGELRLHARSLLREVGFGLGTLPAGPRLLRDRRLDAGALLLDGCLDAIGLPRQLGLDTLALLRQFGRYPGLLLRDLCLDPRPLLGELGLDTLALLDQLGDLRLDLGPLARDLGLELRLLALERGLDLPALLRDLRLHPRPLLGDLPLDPRALLSDLGLEARPLLGQARVRGLGSPRLDPGELLHVGPGRALALDLGQPFARAGEIPLRPLTGVGQLSLELLARVPELGLQPLPRRLQLPLHAIALLRALALDPLEAPQGVGQLGTHLGGGLVDRLSGAGLGERQLQRAHARLHLVDPVRQPALLRQRRLQRVDLGARLLDLRLDAFLGLGRAGQVAPHAVDGRAHGLELPSQPLALRLALLGLAAQPLALLARLVLVERAALLQPVAQGFELGLHLVEGAVRVGQARVQARAGLLQLDQAGARGRRLGPRALGLGARLSQLGRGLLEGALDVLRAPRRRIDDLGDLHFGRGRAFGQLALRAGQRGRQVADRPERDDRAGAQHVLLEVRLPGHGGVDPFDDRLVALLQLRERVAARSGDLERLEEAVELEALAHAHGHERERHLELVAVLAERGRLDLASALRKLSVEAQRLHQRPPEHARGGPAEQRLSRAAPARDRAIPVGEHEAGIHELAQQLFDDLRGGGARGDRVLVHTSSSRSAYPSRLTTGRAPASDMC